MIRVLLADDQALVRDGISALLEMQEDFVTRAVANGREALHAALKEPPDIAVLDVRMPVMDGVECTRMLKEAHPDLPVLVLTTFDDRGLVRRSLDAGANAYLLKDADPDVLANAVRLLVSGRRLIPGDLARELLDERDLARTAGPGVSFPDEPLTERQREILDLLASGSTNREIAERLGLSEGTVKNAVSEIYARLNVRDRVQAVLKARGG